MIHSKPHYSAQHGFSLLEILVAFSILAISLGVILNIFSSGLRSAILAEDYITAVALSESLLARTGVEQPLQDEIIVGEHNQKYDWRVATEQFVIPILAEQEEDPEYILYKINVTVSWGDGDSERAVELNTLRLGSIEG